MDTKDKLEIVLVEDDNLVCEEFANAILASEDLYLSGVTNNAHKALEYIEEKLPDALILDLELHQGDGNGLEVLEGIRHLDLPKKPYILITTNNSSSTTYQAARGLGADFIMSKHQSGYSVKSVLDFLRITRPFIKESHPADSSKNFSEESKEQYTKKLRRQIMEELNHVGISPKAVGYQYLTDAILIMQQHPSQNICTIIAEQYRKSESSVERAMQNAINRAWKTSDIEDLLYYYTAKINSSRGNPTVTEFICYYANKFSNRY